MASGFPGGGGPDLYSGIGGRSIPITTTTTMNSNNQYPSSQSPYRTQLSQMFLDPAMSSHQHQILLNRTPSNLTAQQQLQEHLFRKRTLADFQAQQQQQQQQQQQAAALNGLLNLRSVKPRTMVYQQLQQQQSYSSPISTLSPVEFPANSSGNILPPEFSSTSPLLTQRYNLPLIQQLRYQNHHQLQQQQQPNLSTVLSRNPTLPKLPSVSNVLQENNNNNNVGGGGVVLEQDSENTKMMDRLQELEKQLLDDKELEADAVSVITSTTNSEWSETIQNLIAPASTLSSSTVSPSPTSSSSSVTTPAQPVCSKQTVIEAASAICDGKFDVASEILTRASKVSNLGGNSEQRLMEYMFLALKSRINSVENPFPGAELYSKEHADSIQLLYEISPCFKLGFMAANLAILEATQDVDGFHVVDFHIGQGGHYVNLLHALSSRQQGKAAISLKITAAGTGGDEEKERLRMVGDMLSQVAERVGGACLEFNVVSCNKLSDLTRESLGCAVDEPLVVNFAFNLYRMPDESVSTENPRDELLRRVKALGPRLVTLVEQEMNTNTAPFMARVNEACSYYGALFDSIESTTVDNADRVKVEEALSRNLANSIACEGGERVERCEVFGKWRARMGMAGFALNPMSQNVAETMKARLSSASRVNPGFTVKEENGGICFGWLGKTLTVASAWR